MEAKTICPMCHMLGEDGGHMFLKCKAVKQCWQEMNLEHIKCQVVEQRTGAEVLQMVVGSGGNSTGNSDQLVVDLLGHKK